MELKLGNSLIPVTGVVLLLRSLLEGNYWQAVPFCCRCWHNADRARLLLSIRWAVEQFNPRAVLFRESERLDWGCGSAGSEPAAADADRGRRRLLRDGDPHGAFFRQYLGLADRRHGRFHPHGAHLATGGDRGDGSVAHAVAQPQPAANSVASKRPPWLAVPAAALLAIALHPASNVLQSLVRQLYPISDSVRPALERMQEMFCQADFATLVLVIAILPALCEELAFRGFILSGFDTSGHEWRAIVNRALFFGLTHGVLQQSLLACLLGTILGFLAVQSGSILPGIVFHVVHNALALASTRITPEMVPDVPALRTLVTPLDGGGCLFAWPVALAGGLAATLLLVWFARLRVRYRWKKSWPRPSVTAGRRPRWCRRKPLCGFAGDR